MFLALSIAVVVGSVAGWLVGELVRETGFGFLGNILIGIVGASTNLPDATPTRAWFLGCRHCHWSDNFPLSRLVYKALAFLRPNVLAALQ